MPSNNIRLVIFDLDGVLTSTSREHLMAWQKLCEEIDIEFHEDIEEHTKGVSRLDSLEIVLEASKTTKRFSDIQKHQFATRKNEIYQEMIRKYTPHHVYKGVLPLLKFLQQNNIKIALGSASKNGPMLIEKLGINDYFDYIVDPSNVGSKPQPDIFLDAMKYFGYSPKECIGVEDAVAGIQAINAAGMYAIGIGDPSILTEANIVYPTIESIDFTTLSTVIKGGVQ